MKELIDSFKNGEELYYKNAVFHTIINGLANGMTEHQAIEHLIEINESLTNHMEELLKSTNRIITLS